MPVASRLSRADIVAEARRWIGTPYHHQASQRGAGADCIGLARGIWRAFFGADPETLPGYGRDWAEATGQETLIEGARRHLVEVEPLMALPGDLIIFRYRPRAVAKHVGILASTPPNGEAETAAATFIHAVEGVPVSEVPLTRWWRRRIAAAFTFPGIID